MKNKLTFSKKFGRVGLEFVLTAAANTKHLIITREAIAPRGIDAVKKTNRSS